MPINGLTLSLPETWPDRASWRQPWRLLALAGRIFGPRRPVELPKTAMKQWGLPEYLLKEFHNIPNGNFSNKLTSGYSRSFDLSMLGMTHAARRAAAREISGAKSVLDVGCSSGSLASEFKKSGISDVWGVDASPYLLKIATEKHPGIKFAHGLAERLPFEAKRFDAVGACFLFHELPIKIAETALAEFNRVLSPGGTVVITEPSPEQIRIKSWWSLFKLAGFKGLYFHFLARVVYEPYVEEWHSIDAKNWFEDHGFKLLKDQTRLPFRVLVAKKETDLTK
jgi:ubiquinone/menaquinone biosynthesis C-methylase UbiE